MFTIKTYDELTKDELYKILQLRINVFVVEQETYYEDLDDHDQQALHLMHMVDNKLLAYARMLPPGEIFEEASFGRIITAPETRGTGLGKKMMKTIMDTIYTEWGNPPIFIQAQDYLTDFYHSFGFVPVSETYTYECLPHRDMLYSPLTEDLSNEGLNALCTGNSELSKKRERGNTNMAKFKGKGVVVAGLIAGAAGYLRKKENRDKVLDMVGMAKEKVTDFANTQKENLSNQKEAEAESLQDTAKAAAGSSDLKIEENEMVSEGAQTTVQYYNEKQDDKVQESDDKKE